MIRKVTSHSFLILLLTFFFVASFVITSCNTSTGESILEGNKRLVLNMNAELWNKGNLDRVHEFFSPDFVLHFLPDGSELRGIDSLQIHEKEHREAFPDWKEDIKHIVADRDLVVIHFVSRGTNEGSFLGNPPTGKQIQINEMSIFRIADGKIAEQWLLPDIFSMQQQLAQKEKE